eukprot:m.310781 g.310781  ORF g.310781 m.310781 type:complete len:393 (-) comp20214_c0_seq5:139-1317(-)
METACGSGTQHNPLTLIQEIPIGRKKSNPFYIVGRMDHMFYYAKKKILLLCCLGSDIVLVVDTYRGITLPKDFAFDTPQGCVVHPATEDLWVTSATGLWCVDSTWCERDGQSNVTAPLQLDDADQIRLSSHRPDALIIVGAGEGSDAHIAIINACTRTQLLSIPLPCHPEGLSIHPVRQRLYVNLADTCSMVVLDLNGLEGHSGDTPAAIGPPMTLALADGCQDNFPVGVLDDTTAEAPDVAVTVTRRPPRVHLITLGPTGGTAMGGADRGNNSGMGQKRAGPAAPTWVCAADADDVCYDAARDAVYVPTGSGVVDTFYVERSPDPVHRPSGSNAGVDQNSPVSLRPGGRVTSAVGARTGLFVPERDRLYVAAPATAVAPARLLVYAPSERA